MVQRFQSHFTSRRLPFALFALEAAAGLSVWQSGEIHQAHRKDHIRGASQLRSRALFADSEEFDVTLVLDLLFIGEAAATEIETMEQDNPLVLHLCGAVQQQATGQQVAAAARAQNFTVQADDSHDCRIQATSRSYNSEAEAIFGAGYFSLKVQILLPVRMASKREIGKDEVTNLVEAGFKMHTGGQTQFLSLLYGDKNFMTVLSINIHKTLISETTATVSPTGAPTTKGTSTPTIEPTKRPSPRPTPRPTISPSPRPTPVPTILPSPDPSPVPSDSPSEVPSRAPSQTPSSHPKKFPSTGPTEPMDTPMSPPTTGDRTTEGFLNGGNTSAGESGNGNKQDPFLIAAIAGGLATIVVSCFFICCMWCRRRDINRHEKKLNVLYERDGQSSQRTAYMVPDIVELDEDHQSLANTSLGEQTAGRYITPKKQQLQQQREPNVRDIRPIKALESFDENSLYTTPYSLRLDDSASFFPTPSTRTSSSLSSYRIGNLEFSDNILFPMSDATIDSSEGMNSADPFSLPGSSSIGRIIDLDTEKNHSVAKGSHKQFCRPGFKADSDNVRFMPGSTSTTGPFSVDEGPIDLDTEEPYAAIPQKKTFKLRPLSSTKIRDSRKHSLGKPHSVDEGPIDLDTHRPYKRATSNSHVKDPQECYRADSGTEVESQPDEQRARQVSQALDDSHFDLNAHMDEWSSEFEEFDHDSHFSSDPPNPSSPSYSSKSTAKIGNIARSFSTSLAAPEEESEQSFASMEGEEKCEVSEEHPGGVNALGTSSLRGRTEESNQRSATTPSPIYTMDLTSDSHRFERPQSVTSVSSQMSLSSISSRGSLTRMVQKSSHLQNRNSEPNTHLTPHAKIHDDDAEIEVTPLQHNHYIPVVTPEVKECDEEGDEEEASDLDSSSDSESDGNGVLGMQAREDGSTSSVSTGMSPWLYDTLEQTLGPRSITADLESLGGSTNKSRSKASIGGGAESVASGASSRISYCSSLARSGVSLPRSLEHDLKRLELQLAVLDSDQMTTSSVTVPSIAGNSLTSTICSRNRAPKILGKRRFVVDVPPGKLGVILANHHDGKGTIVTEVREHSSLKGKLAPGDKLMAVDGQDVTDMVVSQITSLMASKAGQDRRLTFISSVTHDQRDLSGSIKSH